MKRIFVEEAQCLLIYSSYRVDFTELAFLKYLNALLIFLTGSMSVSMSIELLNMFRRFDRCFKVVRSPCNRPKLGYSVRNSCEIVDLDFELSCYQAKYPGALGRCIVYVHSHSMLEDVYNRSGHVGSMTRYSSNFTVRENQQSFEKIGLLECNP